MQFQIWLNCPSPNRRLFTVAAPFVSQGPVDCSRYATRWAVMTQAFRRAKRSLKRPGGGGREGGISATQAITLPHRVNHPQENTQRRPRFAATPTPQHDFKHARRRGGGGVRLCLHVFPESTYCNKAPSSEGPPPPVQRRMIQHTHTQTETATAAELPATSLRQKRKHFAF